MKKKHMYVYTLWFMYVKKITIIIFLNFLSKSICTYTRYALCMYGKYLLWKITINSFWKISHKNICTYTRYAFYVRKITDFRSNKFNLEIMHRYFYLDTILMWFIWMLNYFDSFIWSLICEYNTHNTNLLHLYLDN